VGVFNVGGRNIPTTSTLESTVFGGVDAAFGGVDAAASLSASAGMNLHVLTANVSASVYGGVVLNVLTSPTAPALVTVSSNITSPPATTVGGGSEGNAPSRYRAARNDAAFNVGQPAMIAAIAMRQRIAGLGRLTQRTPASTS
jgi:hypothetical protein